MERIKNEPIYLKVHSKTKAMKNAINFLKNIKLKDNVILIFHNDTDGICSAVLMDTLLDKLNKNERAFISQPMPTEKTLIKNIQTYMPNKLIFLDLAVDQQYNILKILKQACEILVIDHHQITRNLNAVGIAHYNPRFENNEIYRSCSYVTYKICSQMGLPKNLNWIALLGAIGDYDLAFSQDLINEVKDDYPELNVNEPYKSIFGRLSDMITAANVTNSMSYEQIVKVLKNSKNPEGFISENEQILKAYQDVENEILSIMVDAENNSLTYKNLIIYNLNSKYRLRSQISTRLSEKYRDSVILVYEKIKNDIKISSRNQSKRVNVAEILSKATDGLKASSGGHAAAAGATIKAGDWETFKERIINLLA